MDVGSREAAEDAKAIGSSFSAPSAPLREMATGRWRDDGARPKRATVPSVRQGTMAAAVRPRSHRVLSGAGDDWLLAHRVISREVVLATTVRNLAEFAIQV
jgi:hypothetical protein